MAGENGRTLKSPDRVSISFKTISMSYSGTIEASFDNKSTHATFTIGETSTNEGAKFSTDGSLPHTLSPGAETFDAIGILILGVGGYANSAKITIPFTITNVQDPSKSFSGSFYVYCSGGNYYPDFLNVETEGGNLSQTVQLGESATEHELNPNPTYDLGTVNFQLNDSGLVIGMESNSYTLSDFASALQDILSDGGE